MSFLFDVERGWSFKADNLGLVMGFGTTLNLPRVFEILLRGSSN